MAFSLELGANLRTGELEMMLRKVFLMVCEGIERREQDFLDVCTLNFEEMRGCERFE